MSVLVPDPQVFNYIRQGFEIAAYRRECDEFYAWCISSHCDSKDIHKESKRFVKSLMWLNEWSFDVKYEQKDLDKSEYYPFVKWEIVDVRPLQLLKYLICVRYNIEKETIWRVGTPEANKKRIPEQQLEDLELLERWIDCLKMAIIDKIPEYDEAKWSDAPPDKYTFANQ